ncbi:hypothetical protein ABD76_28135 [Paenibacillus dendritiformis]|uniref:hypothetical protein n=1 Tax=Paenibacillus dendritiformis TaxID=130049 RepID=UPI0018CCFB48|nr:hypothetical protein [Paenibacillus dendritiformis]MBG9796088.1 hypothetical protein [Paenibacillus dendritiformis]
MAGDNTALVEQVTRGAGYNAALAEQVTRGAGYNAALAEQVTRGAGYNAALAEQMKKPSATYLAFNSSSALRISNQYLQRSQSLGAADDDILAAGEYA